LPSRCFFLSRGFPARIRRPLIDKHNLERCHHVLSLFRREVPNTVQEPHFINCPQLITCRMRMLPHHFQRYAEWPVNLRGGEWNDQNGAQHIVHFIGRNHNARPDFLELRALGWIRVKPIDGKPLNACLALAIPHRLGHSMVFLVAHRRCYPNP